MYDYKEPWKIRIAGALNELLREASAPAGAGAIEAIEPSRIIAEIPPKPEMGDLGFPMFGYAKLLRKGPPQIAALVCEKLILAGVSGGFGAEGPYVNVRLDRGEAVPAILAEILDTFDTFDNKDR
ncbi:MAG: arginine--tRNA ligase, partial [Spirochaetaceae bacterium]|nr:arginine--tRNA ligase [Spirochaetaceae bacterium]